MPKPGIAEIVYPTLFRGNYHQVAVNLAYTHFWVARHQRTYIERFGITWVQFSILSTLREYFPYAVSGSKVGVRIPHIISKPTGAMQPLTAKRFVEYNKVTTDDKERGFLITRKGLELLTRIDKRISKLDKIVDGLSPEEAATLSHLLDKLRSEPPQKRPSSAVHP